MAYLGYKHSEETKRKISESEKGKIVSIETRLRIGLAAKGRRLSPQTRQKMSLAKSGANAYQWKGGISRKYRTGYYSKEYIEWRQKVFERDNFTCVCGFSGRQGYITAHHIKSFSQFPELRFVVENGLTLCEPCHAKTDNYKGRARRRTN